MSLDTVYACMHLCTQLGFDGLLSISKCILFVKNVYKRLGDSNIDKKVLFSRHNKIYMYICKDKLTYEVKESESMIDL